MADDLLNYVTDNWAQILGINPAGGPWSATGVQPPAPPPAQVMRNPGMFSPSGAAEGPNFGPGGGFGGGFVPPESVPTDTVTNAMAGPIPSWDSGGGPGPGSAQAAPSPPGGGLMPGASAAPVPSNLAPGNVPVSPRPTGGGSQMAFGGPPAPYGAPGTPGGPPAPFAPAPGQPPTPQMIPGPTGPTPVPMRPPASAFGGAPQTSTAGGLAAMLGLDSPDNRRLALGAGLAGFGRGLEKVGALHPGAPAAQAVAAGAGGALTGGTQFMQHDELMKRQAQKDFFEQTINADNQWMKDKTFPYTLQHLQASTDYLNRKYGVGTAGGKNMWTSDVTQIGRMRMADQALDNEKKRHIQDLKEKREAGVDTSKELENLDEWEQKKKDDIYKGYHVDPNNYEGSKSNPINADKLTSEQQLETMPAGTYYKYTDPKTGKEVVTQRDYTSRPNTQDPLYQQQQQQQQQPQPQPSPGQPQAYDSAEEEALRG
jgi:hypothetical protein